MHRHPRDSGFSLVELLTVIAVIGILLSGAVVSYWYATSRTHLIVCQSNRRVFDSSIQMYRSDHGGLPPGTIDDLIPYVHNFDSAVICPGGQDTRLAYDPVAERTVCYFHDD